jgi:ATP-dependent Clp protease adaptor protein ClpS
MSDSEKARESAAANGGASGSSGGSGGEGAVAKPKSASNSKAQPQTKKRTRTKTRRKSKQLPPYHVILLDDNDHTYAYVIEMLKKIFGHPEERGNQLAKEVDTQGRVIVMTTHKELAELKRDQIHGFGADWRLEASKGSMSAKIEPAASK